MEILQGQYRNGLKTSKGHLKALQIQTDKGIQTVRLPKLLRAIAQQELTLGDTVRLWVVAAPKTKKKLKKNAKKAKGKTQKKAQARLALRQNWRAIQLIPLSPQLTMAIPNPQQAALTVQVCQKKNCCRRGGTALWAALKTRQTSLQSAACETQSAAPAKTTIGSFVLEAVGCLGGCKRGPNIRILPDNVKYRSVQPVDLDQILQKHR